MRSGTRILVLPAMAAAMLLLATAAAVLPSALPAAAGPLPVVSTSAAASHTCVVQPSGGAELGPERLEPTGIRRRTA